MASHRHKSKLRLPRRTPPPLPASQGTAEPRADADAGPDEPAAILFRAPSSLTECVPSNITWTGGTAPYMLLVKLGDGSETLRQFTSIAATHFVWAPDVAPGTPVSLQVVDARTALASTYDAVVVQENPSPGAGADAAGGCSTPAPSGGPAPSPSPGPSSSPSLRTSTQLRSPSEYALPTPVVPRKNAVGGTVIALTVVGAVILLLLLVVLGTFRLRHSRMAVRRGDSSRRRNDADTTKQHALVEGGHSDNVNDDDGSDGPGELAGDSDSTDDDHSIDRPHSRPLNPFEDPANVVYTEETFAASPVLDFDPDDTDGHAHFPHTTTSLLPPPLPSIPSPRVATAAAAPARQGPLQATVDIAPWLLPERPRLPPVQRKIHTSTSLSDPTTARLSSSTAASSLSTPPPSYRTHPSTGSIYIPVAAPPQASDDPLFPPPAYMPAPPPASTLTFRPGSRMPSPTPALMKKANWG